jgi:hypothetical protein
MTLIAAGAGSTGGLTAFAMKRIFFRADRKHQTNEIGGGQNETSRGTNRNRIEN